MPARDQRELLAARVITLGFSELPGGLGLGSAASELGSLVIDEEAYVASFADAARSLSFVEAKTCMAVLRGIRTAANALHFSGERSLSTNRDPELALG